VAPVCQQFVKAYFWVEFNIYSAMMIWYSSSLLPYL